jgi:FKBP-type peptidyl-prolyl cis-trans isomerase
MRIAPLALALLLAPAAARAADAPAAKPDAKASKPSASAAKADEKTLYALGVVVGKNLEVFSLSSAELEVVLKAVRDEVAGKAKIELNPQAQGAINELAKTRTAAVASRYLAKVSSEKGARKTASGAIVFSEKEGTGATPTAADKVKVNYTGTLPSGRVFDASANHGGPAEFQLSGVIKCWTEALQMMKVGGKARVVCPPEIAYGMSSQPGIPPNSVLTFQVELLEIVK